MIRRYALLAPVVALFGGGWSCLDRVELGRGATDATSTAGTTDAASGSATAEPDMQSAVTSPGEPAIIVAQGDEVIPQTRLDLTAVWPDVDDVVAWHWTVAQPIGSTSVFMPDANAPSPGFECNVAGVYDFEVVMRRRDGSSARARYLVAVNPDEALHIELIWHSPGDPDETDVGPAAGTDLDLHFASERASLHIGPDYDGDGQPDPWFDALYDCYWYNVSPGWSDDGFSGPSLDRDDTDGAGPENINLDTPTLGECYTIGVHFWDDVAGFGPVDVTVRVYAFGTLVFELAGVHLAVRDMWRVGTICWDAAPAVTARRVCATTRAVCAVDADCEDDDCGLDITPDYDTTIFAGTD